MEVRRNMSSHIPSSVIRCFRRIVKREPTRARRATNVWLRHHADGIRGDVLGIGSGADEDREGGTYRDYFSKCCSYTTSDIRAEIGCDLVLNACSMPEIRDETYDCIFCSGVLEHVDDYGSTLREIARILKREGVLLMGFAFRQGIHGAPKDYWRFTEHGIRHVLLDGYEILDLTAMDDSVTGFPVAYWVKAKKR